MAIDVRRSPAIAPAASLLAIVWRVAGQVSTSPTPLREGVFSDPAHAISLVSSSSFLIREIVLAQELLDQTAKPSTVDVSESTQTTLPPPLRRSKR
jgi:hypothetical protein